jgi:choline dehydrogenase-like flavoprotein
VHGIGNFYIAGSSVFPTSSSNHPTMTLVALALRLSDRLVDQLKRQATVVDGEAKPQFAAV